jgi:hypothetical protein
MFQFFPTLAGFLMIIPSDGSYFNHLAKQKCRRPVPGGGEIVIHVRTYSSQ